MDAWLSSGLVRLFLGKWDVAIDHFARAMRLSPFEPKFVCHASRNRERTFLRRCYDEAAAWAAKSIGENPKYPPVWRTAAASNALLGRQEQAQNAMARLRQLDPTLRIATLKSVVPSPPT